MVERPPSPPPSTMPGLIRTRYGLTQRRPSVSNEKSSASSSGGSDSKIRILTTVLLGGGKVSSDSNSSDSTTDPLDDSTGHLSRTVSDDLLLRITPAPPAAKLSAHVSADADVPPIPATIGISSKVQVHPATDGKQELPPIPEEAKSAVSRRRPLKSALATATSSSSTETKNNPKTVQFSNLEIRTYPLTLGDNPSVSSGPPLTLDWNHEITHTFSVDAYESQLAPPEDRRPLAAMARPASLRVAILCDDARIGLRTVQATVREVEAVKRQRRRTVESLGSNPVARLLRRAVCKCPPKRS